MLLVNARLDFDEVVDLLGDTSTTTRCPTRQQLQSDPCSVRIRRAVIDVARMTSAAPPSYRLSAPPRPRLHRLTDRRPPGMTFAVRPESNSRPRPPYREMSPLRVAQRQPRSCAPWFLDSADFSAAVAAYPGHLTPRLAEALQAEAHDFLHRGGIRRTHHLAATTAASRRTRPCPAVTLSPSISPRCTTSSNTDEPSAKQPDN